MTATAGLAHSLRWVATGGELLLVVWSIPFAILLIGLPLVWGIRLALELVEKLFGL